MEQPPSRSSLSDPPPPTQGPVPLFDVQLRYLTDSYLGFFQERKRIEEVYVESLKKLHRKITSIDAFLNEKNEPSTVRSVWSEVVENVDREAQARQALCATLSSDVIVPLTTLKETQERTRKRIKEDLKESSTAYNEYAESMLPKLKSRYAKKYSEVEEQKRAAMATPGASSLTSPTPNAEASKLNSSNHARPIVTAPQPLRALDRRPSGSAPSGRNRSPSSSTAFSDLAHQGKKQLNQLIGGFLDKGGSVKDGGRESQALRTVHREYRKGVHWLETLRLRRTKILESGYKVSFAYAVKVIRSLNVGQSLEMFVEELSVMMKSVLEKYADNMTATSSTQTQLSSHMRAMLERISPDKDVAKIKTQIPRSLASAIPEPILYEHGLVGECNDLIFGFSLVDYATAKALPEGAIPKIVQICIEEVDRRGLESEGIYRVSGRHAVVQALQHEIERDESAFRFTAKDDLYLRELPEPVFRFPLQDRIQHTEDRDEHISNKFMLIRSKLRRLPPVHQSTMKAIIEHLARVASKSSKNKMDAKNLAIVFGPVIFGDDEIPKGGDLLSVQSAKDTVMEDVISHAHLLYDHDAVHNSPPLPPTPAGEPVPQVSYGSKRTKVTTVPPPDSPPTIPQDFTPRLPSRPNNSIHPSSRANIGSPTSRSKVLPEKALPTVHSASSSEDIQQAPPTPIAQSSSLDGTQGDGNSILFPVHDADEISQYSDLRSQNYSVGSSIDTLDSK
ncbi:hypothetical protein CVT26_002676 [Gymnopilus dilepis]|uniref:Rho-GAP domain-containing protein n=1 Tax=Gymnopilus dilepis TaxID=231916 RepID=A0A409VCF5_9AGAR|nr:hypothetical protein CVT26_002676 [Gymnopilus dilepis]